MIQRLIYLTFPLVMAACGENHKNTPPPSAPHIKSFRGKNGCGIPLASSYDKLNSIEINDHGARPTDKAIYLSQLNAMPDYFLKVFEERNIIVHMIDGPVTDFPEWGGLKGETPRGWEGTGFTWDDVPGLGISDGTYLGNSALRHDAQSLIIHEGSHSLDLALGITEHNKEFIEIFEAEKATKQRGDPYFKYRTVHIQEFFAVSMEDYFCLGGGHKLLKNLYPRTFNFIQDKLEPEILAALAESKKIAEAQ